MMRLAKVALAWVVLMGGLAVGQASKVARAESYHLTVNAKGECTVKCVGARDYSLHVYVPPRSAYLHRPCPDGLYYFPDRELGYPRFLPTSLLASPLVVPGYGPESGFVRCLSLYPSPGVLRY